MTNRPSMTKNYFLEKKRLTWQWLCWYDSMRWRWIDKVQKKTSQNLLQLTIAQATVDTHHARRLQGSSPVRVQRSVAAKGGDSQRCSALVVQDEDLWIWGSGKKEIFNPSLVVCAFLFFLMIWFWWWWVLWTRGWLWCFPTRYILQWFSWFLFFIFRLIFYNTKLNSLWCWVHEKLVAS